MAMGSFTCLKTSVCTKDFSTENFQYVMFDYLHRNPEGLCPLLFINSRTQSGGKSLLKIKLKTLVIQLKEPPLLCCHFLARLFTASIIFLCSSNNLLYLLKEAARGSRDGADLHLQLLFVMFLDEEMPCWEFSARQLCQP